MKLFDEIILLSNQYVDFGVQKGNRGYIIEIYDDGNIEVEFSNSKTGITYAQVVIKSSDVYIIYVDN